MGVVSRVSFFYGEKCLTKQVYITFAYNYIINLNFLLLSVKCDILGHPIQ